MTLDARHPGMAILSFAVGAFAIGVSEFAAMGLLPYYAAGFGVAEPAAGNAVSAYAIGVVVGAPVLAVAGARLPRKPFLIGLIAFFGLANLLGAFAPTMGTLTLSRFLAGLPHGAFLGIAMLTAAEMLPKGRRARGVALVMTGLTVANVIGVPAAGAIGQAVGWRSLFVIVAVIAAASVALIARFAPHVEADTSASPLSQIGGLANRAVWLTLLTGAVGFGGVFAVYAYLSAAMIDVGNAPAWAIPLVLSVFGIGATIGNVVSSRLASWSRFGGALVLLCGMTAAPILYALVMGNWPLMTVSIFVLGITAGLFIPLQMRLMDVAGNAQTLAAAMNHAAFNLANALGPFFAGMALSAGYGWASTGWVGAAMAAAGIVVLGIAFMDSRQPGREKPGTAVPLANDA